MCAVCAKFLYFVGQCLDGFVSFRVIQMVSGRGSEWSSFLCVQLGIVSPFLGDCPRQTLEVFQVARGCVEEGGFGVAGPAMVSHTVLYIFEFTMILNILHTLVLNSTLVPSLPLGPGRFVG